MTRARMPRPHEVAAARRDPRLLRALQERDDDLTWRARGVCQSVDPEVFFPAPSEPADAAVALCRTCDVQGACLAWALEVGDCHGVWGATTPRERRAMLVAWHSDEMQAAQLAALPAPAAVPLPAPQPVAAAVPLPALQPVAGAVPLPALQPAPALTAVVRPAVGIPSLPPPRELATSA